MSAFRRTAPDVRDIVAVDFHVAEAVDGRQVIAGKIPKEVFLK